MHHLGMTYTQVRDAVITMLDDWVGERGRVPLERLAPAVHDVTVAPKMSPEGRIAAITWFGTALSSEQVRKHDLSCCRGTYSARYFGGLLLHPESAPELNFGDIQL